MRVILTGGAGFIGSAVLSALNRDGITDIIVVDNLGSSEKWANLVGKRFNRYIHKDEFLELLLSKSWTEKPDVIIHLGACSATTETDADYLLHNNHFYSQVVCEFARSKGARFIYASSAATYGLGENGYSDNPATLDKLKPINRYGFSKHLFDQWIVSEGLINEVVGLKFFNVFGPNEYHKGSMVSMVYRACQQIKETGTVKLFKSVSPKYRDGEQRRDFIYVKDCVRIIQMLMGAAHKSNGIFNVGSGSSRTWNELATAVFKSMKLSPQIEYIDMPAHLVPGYQNFTEADVERLRRALGGTLAITPLEDAVDDYVTHYLSHGPVFI